MLTGCSGLYGGRWCVVAAAVDLPGLCLRFEQGENIPPPHPGWCVGLLTQLLLLPAGAAAVCATGNTDAMQLLGGLLSVLPERVSKTMQAHKEVLLKRVSGRQ